MLVDTTHAQVPQKHFPKMKLFSLFTVTLPSLALFGHALQPPKLGTPNIVEGRSRPSSVDSCVPITSDICVPIPSIPTIDLDLLKRASAGLLWGPEYIGNLKLSLTNIHSHPFGKFKTAQPHVNFHVDREKIPPATGYKGVLNLHITVYTEEDKKCAYVWDSVKDTTYFDSCFDDWTSGIREVAESIREILTKVLENANLIATVAIIAALIVALVGALSSLVAVVAV